jgi:uncharacterized protein (DUF427 family)
MDLWRWRGQDRPPWAVVPGPGQESVWDYPRPPIWQPVSARIRVELDGVLVADTTAALRVLETSHPPVFYVPPADVLVPLVRSRRSSLCEYKGLAGYYDVLSQRDAAWYYPDPSPRFAALKDHVAFYPGRMDACWVDDERVVAQEGDFYGSWVTSAVVGPFKGAPGTSGW